MFSSIKGDHKTLGHCSLAFHFFVILRWSDIRSLKYVIVSGSQPMTTDVTSYADNRVIN